MVDPLTVEAVFRRCPSESFDFELTSELDPLDLIGGQDRAREALILGTGVRHQGFNLYVLGPAGHGLRSLVTRFLEGRAAEGSVPPDLCYLNNFDDPASPVLLRLPPGLGRQLRGDIERLIEELGGAIPAVFESDEYQNRLHELKQAMSEQQRDAVESVRREAREHDILLLSTPSGFTFAPADENGEMMSPDAYQALDQEERERIERTVEILQEKLTKAIRQMPKLTKSLREQVNALNEEMLQSVIGAPLGELEERYADHEGVLAHLSGIRESILHHVDAFHSDQPEVPPEAVFSRLRINLLVDHGDTEGAPVVYQDLPSHQHLVGRIEHQVHNGTLLTDFSLIRAGALHRASGGYLVLDVRALLTQPGAWETLKRVLDGGQIRTESLEQAYGLISTMTLEPEPVPLDVKVVLLGDRLLYYLLCEHDPDFLALFKVQADLDDEFDRDHGKLDLYARMVAMLVQEERLRPLDPEGVAAVIERASRLADDQCRLTARHRDLHDLLVEADHWAGIAGREVIGREAVERAVDEQRHRAGRVRERSQEAIIRGTLLIDTQGTRVGQVNGLTVMQLTNHGFGQPIRITATARPGNGQVVDIEREAKMGGPIHSKAVMILSRYLANRYAGDEPLSLSASLAFEQSYGGVEGDSASVAEACALVSAIARIPLDQAFAVTGSINQHGEVQAVGGVNEKVEGFFEVCRARGGAEGQAVILPAANLEHLMLRSEVREAVASGAFRLYAIRHVDEALELLTEAEEENHSLDDRVAERLRAFRAAVRRSRSRPATTSDGGDGNHGDGDVGEADGRE
ncbi:Lon protease family protein [Halomonas stenophila]|uniref:endopeptidase La n=1 Tax=Halomonas stenophila TaxID=795312 RepID=A0A7W5EXP1_9GAMM|nr:ATP-binding protein [Halomonas stenophila]MBB3232205.1 lon-related putative ATP-dependent protease [Halomonas stenophila]